MQFWNINDGSNLIQLKPQLYSTTLAHVYAHLPRSISAACYEILLPLPSKQQPQLQKQARKQNISKQQIQLKQPKKLFIVGTEHGNICGYEENNSNIEEVPVFFLRLQHQQQQLLLQNAVNSVKPSLEDSGFINNNNSSNNNNNNSILYEKGETSSLRAGNTAVSRKEKFVAATTSSAAHRATGIVDADGNMDPNISVYSNNIFGGGGGLLHTLPVRTGIINNNHAQDDNNLMLSTKNNFLQSLVNGAIIKSAAATSLVPRKPTQINYSSSNNHNNNSNNSHVNQRAYVGQTATATPTMQHYLDSNSVSTIGKFNNLIMKYSFGNILHLFVQSFFVFII